MIAKTPAAIVSGVESSVIIAALKAGFDLNQLAKEELEFNRGVEGEG